MVFVFEMDQNTMLEYLSPRYTIITKKKEPWKMTYSNNTVLVVMTCSILCTFGLTEALWIISIKAVHQKNSLYVSPELLYLYLSESFESMKSVMKVPGSLWNVRYCLKSVVDYVGVAINVLKENKLGIQNNFFFPWGFY